MGGKKDSPSKWWALVVSMVMLASAERRSSEDGTSGMRHTEHVEWIQNRHPGEELQFASITRKLPGKDSNLE
jgi:hypothetical protein